MGGGPDLIRAPDSPPRTPLVVVAGNPNTGKTTLFNRLTGSHQRVGNYAGVTVDRHEGRASLARHGRVRLVDVPGTYSLSARSAEEQLAIQVLCGLPPHEVPDLAVILVDVTQLSRNLYLVLINVERYAHLNVARLDLIQEGSAALFRAVDGFDWRRGLLFRTYAVHWLNQAFRSYLYNFGNTVRVPVYLQKAMKHVREAVERIGDPSASPEEIAAEADIGVGLVQSALAASRSTLSIDTPLQTGEEGTGLADVLGEEPDGGVYSVEMEDVSLAEGLQAALDRLSERERYVVEMRFGSGREREHTLSEVAHELGVSLERVRQIQVRAIHKMQTPGLRKAIDPFL